MDWKRGEAIKKTDNSEEKTIDLKDIKYRICYIVNKELEEFKMHDLKDNQFGNWILK
jgi:hypothetical protein